MTATRFVVVIALLGFLAACGSDREVPRGIGSDTDDMKRSPCACWQVPVKPVKPEDLERYRRMSV